MEGDRILYRGSKVSVIVVNWNGATLLAACLRSLSAQTYRDFEIIVVDNGSEDRSAINVAHAFSQVTLVALGENSGFAGGNLAALRIANGEFLALVNNDTRVEPYWLEKLIQPMLHNSALGICASKIIIEGSGKIDSIGTAVTTAGVGFNCTAREHSDSHEAFAPVFGACGAAALYRGRMLEEIGFFDKDFFLYDEDTDLSFRAQLAGWKCVYVPTAVVYHIGHATTGRLSDTHVYYHTRNLEFVWIKNMPLGLMLRFAHHKLIQELGSFCYLCLRHGKWRPYFRAKRDALKMIPVMLRRRKEVQSRRRVSNKYLRQLMTSIFSLVIIRRKFFQFVKG